MPTVAPPAAGASQTEINDFIAAVRAQPESHAHGDDMGKMAEHMAAMDLVPRDEATHIAVSDGDWFDKSTWHNGNIPDDNAKVLIPEGVNVQYGSVSDVRLFSVRVDGELDFATDMDSRMIFDTMVVSPTGSLVIGSEVDPVDPNVSVELIVANNGPIDVDWDPMLLSRGLIAHGETSIHGALKDSHDKVIEDPMAGDRSVSFAEAPEGWQIGDKIVIAGTRYDGYKWDGNVGSVRLHETEDEIRFITDIQDNVVYFDEPLEHDHDTPRADLKTSVANYTRNVSIETENAEDAEVFERGHVMFMHSDDVDVRYAEFTDLGRTDKSEDSFQHSDFDPIAPDSNVQGRYSLHLHRTGMEDPDAPAQIIGNAVFGSPGWGFVHHDSNADLINNASYDTHGAGYVAETGNEIGSWVDNIAINASGDSWGQVKVQTKLSNDVFDTARSGDGFWFQGRLVDSSDNIAASVNHGFVYFHRGGDDRVLDFDAEVFDHPDVFLGSDSVSSEDAPIRSFDGNETFAARQGLHVVKAGPEQHHDVWTHIDDFTAWSVQDGVYLEYTSRYVLSDIDLIGKEDTLHSPAGNGIELNKGAGDVVIVDSKIAGFAGGIDFTSNFPNDLVATEDKNFHVLDTVITDVDQAYVNFRPILGQIGSASDFTALAPDLELDPLEFDGTRLNITGIKQDGLGATEFSNPSNDITFESEDIYNYLEDNGYWETTAGDHYFLTDIYFTDRLTGDVYYETTAISLTAERVALFERDRPGLENIEQNGIQDITTDANGISWAGDTALGVAIPAIPGTSASHGADTAESFDGEDLMALLTLSDKDGADRLSEETGLEEDLVLEEAHA